MSMNKVRQISSAFGKPKAAFSLALALIAAPAAWSQNPAAQYRVHCGGGNFIDPNGHAWEADAHYSGGQAANIAATIANTDMPQLYQTERWSDGNNPMTYSFKVLPGQYKVNLHFAEIWDQAFGAGLRVFDVDVNGTVVAPDLDVFAQVGADAALVLNVLATAGADSLITIGFTNKTGNAKIAGIEVLPANPLRATKPPYRIHCGGEDYIDAAGNYWEADSHFSGGAAATIPTSVSNTESPELFQSERWSDPNLGELSYAFDADPGEYTVRLYFAEIYFTTPGERVFGYDINGETKATGWDITAENGPGVAVVKEYAASSVNGKIVINFHNEIQHAKISAIEILPGMPTRAQANRTRALAPMVRASAPGTLDFRWPDGQSVSVLVSDPRGREVTSLRAGASGAITGLRPGFYLVRLKSGSQSAVFHTLVF